MSENLIDWTMEVVVTNYGEIVKQPDYLENKADRPDIDTTWEFQVKNLINYGMKKGFILANVSGARNAGLIFYHKSVFCPSKTTPL